jgi:DNA polymerase-3 subunit delta'
MSTQTKALPWPVVGHRWAVELLRHTLAAGRAPHALLITGPPSIGKGTLARSLAQALLCTAEQKPCGTCRACRRVESGNHPDMRWVEPEREYLKIDQVRELTRQLALAPVEGHWQIAILDRFETATAGAANALLKTLEEPPPNVVMVLLAQEAEALLPTITSRCQILALRILPRTTIEKALVERWDVPPDQARLLSHISSGRLGWAVTAATTPRVLEQRAQRIDDLVRLLQGQRTDRFMYAEELARQPVGAILEHLELWSSWWRDILLLKTSSPVPPTNLDRHAELARMASRIDVTVIHSTLVALHNAIRQLALNTNPRLVLEILFLDVPLLAV